MSTFVIIAVAGITLWLLAELVLPTAFAYIGAWAVWLVTFGHILLEPFDGGESGLASEIGFAVVFVVVVVGYTLLRGT